MSVAVDLTRRVRARLPADPDAERYQPGEMLPLEGPSGAVAGYLYCCPGCGSYSYISIGEGVSGPRWSVTAGDPRDPGTLTLVPSLWHRGACGWHGYLRAGELAPC